MLNLSLTTALLTCLVVATYGSVGVSSDQLPLANIIPKLQAIHEDAKSLLLKNSELKAQILAGLQLQNEKKSQPNAPGTPTNQQLPPPPASATPQPQPTSGTGNLTPAKQKDDKRVIDYSELEEFNRWVDVNLDYAVKNTQASIETLKEEAQQNNGNVDYTDEAIKDGIEGVKYWQSAVIFQDKTLKNEKFEVE